MNEPIGKTFDMLAVITCEFCQNQFTDPNLRGVLIDSVGEVDVIRLLTPTFCDNGHPIFGFNAFDNQVVNLPIHRMN